MSKDNRIIFIVLTAFIILGAYIWWNSKEEVNWGETLEQNLYQPYDLGYLEMILKKSSKNDFEVLDEKLTESLKNHNPANYFLVGKNSFFTKKDFNELQHFVERGNNAFISVNNMDDQLSDFLYFTTKQVVYSDSIYKANIFSNPEKNYSFRFQGKKGLKIFPLSYVDFDYNNEDLLPITELGKIETQSQNEKINFFQVQYGLGSFYIHTNPVLFSNYHLKSEESLAYANAVFGHLGNKNILWDEYSTQYKYEEQNPNHTVSSPLRFILQHKALKLAWYTLLISILLFILFRSKRKQKQIPIIPQLENTSLEFAKSLGALYLQSGTGKALAIELMSMFDNYNRRKYRISRERKDSTIGIQIAQKSRVDIELVKKILVLERQIIYNPESNTKDVMPLYDAIKEYYQKSKR